MQLNNSSLFQTAHPNHVTTKLADTNPLTGESSKSHPEFWQLVERIEQKQSTDTVVELISNSYLGYLVYEFLGKQMASQPISQERFKNTEVPSDNDTFLEHLVKQIMAHRGVQPKE